MNILREQSVPFVRRARRARKFWRELLVSGTVCLVFGCAAPPLVDLYEAAVRRNSVESNPIRSKVFDVAHSYIAQGPWYADTSEFALQEVFSDSVTIT